MKKEYCLDCGKEIESDGIIIHGSLRTDGDMTNIKYVPGGMIYGNVLGYVCNDCSIIGKEIKKEYEESK